MDKLRRDYPSQAFLSRCWLSCAEDFCNAMRRGRFRSDDAPATGPIQGGLQGLECMIGGSRSRLARLQELLPDGRRVWITSLIQPQRNGTQTGALFFIHLQFRKSGQSAAKMVGSTVRWT